MMHGHPRHIGVMDDREGCRV